MGCKDYGLTKIIQWKSGFNIICADCSTNLAFYVTFTHGVCIDLRINDPSIFFQRTCYCRMKLKHKDCT